MREKLMAAPVLLFVANFAAARQAANVPWSGLSAGHARIHAGIVLGTAGRSKSSRRAIRTGLCKE
jgi:hypothetical protein